VRVFLIQDIARNPLITWPKADHSNNDLFRRRFSQQGFTQRGITMELAHKPQLGGLGRSQSTEAQLGRERIKELHRSGRFPDSILNGPGSHVLVFSAERPISVTENDDQVEQESAR